MPEQHRRGTRTVAVDDRKVRVAEARRLDLHQDFAPPRRLQLHSSIVSGLVKSYGGSTPMAFSTAPRVLHFPFSRFVFVLFVRRSSSARICAADSAGSRRVTSSSR
jgi:hypothetical protein